MSRIPWDSGFAESGPRLLDDIVAIDGTPVEVPTELAELERFSQTFQGQVGSSPPTSQPTTP